MNRSTNLNFYLPENSDYRDVSNFNYNFDVIDDAVDSIEKGMAIISVGNTHAAISNGQFVYVRGHGSLTEGMYVAKSAISANATLSSSNLDAITSGGLNALNTKVENIQKGTFYLPNAHCVYAGRNGWNGLNIRISIPTGKSAVGISSATINLGGATVYACTANSVVDITSRISSISCSFSGTNSLTEIAVTIVLESNPLSFNEGIVNISINGGTPSITFA